MVYLSLYFYSHANPQIFYANHGNIVRQFLEADSYDNYVFNSDIWYNKSHWQDSEINITLFQELKIIQTEQISGIYGFCRHFL